MAVNAHTQMDADTAMVISLHRREQIHLNWQPHRSMRMNMKMNMVKIVRMMKPVQKVPKSRSMKKSSIPTTQTTTKTRPNNQQRTKCCDVKVWHQPFITSKFSFLAITSVLSTHCRIYSHSNVLFIGIFN